MKEAPRQHFRWAPHVSGAASVKRKDYEEGGQVEALNQYAAWDRMRASERPLEVGDLLESETGELQICKYIGFEGAVWWLAPAEPAAAPEQQAPATSGPEVGYTDRPAGE
ncbi:MAG TPA: hypothetical protein VJN43_15465 [Bryobacteraceae bacterium]|nr:hypothetical protein [Bryobacteraceae bacterium]